MDFVLSVYPLHQFLFIICLNSFDLDFISKSEKNNGKVEKKNESEKMKNNEDKNEDNDEDKDGVKDEK